MIYRVVPGTLNPRTGDVTVPADSVEVVADTLRLTNKNLQTIALFAPGSWSAVLALPEPPSLMEKAQE